MNNFGETGNGEIAVIPKGTVINGNIDIDGRLDMYGEINGNINSNDRVNICGVVSGDIKANDLHARDSFIEGKIECVQDAIVRENTVIFGDIYVDSIVIDGAVQGKLDVKECVTVGEKAIVESDIKAKAIQVSNGATINGHCSLCYAEVNMDDIFPKAEGEPTAEEEPKAEEELKAEEEPKAEEELKAEEESDKQMQSGKPRAVAKKKNRKKR